MHRQPLLQTEYQCQSVIRSHYRNRIALLLLPLTVVILFVLISSYSNDELETMRKLRKIETPMKITTKTEDYDGVEVATERAEEMEGEEEKGEQEADESELHKESYDQMIEEGRDVIEKEEELALSFQSILEFPIPDLSLNGTISVNNTVQFDDSSNNSSSLIESILNISTTTPNITDEMPILPFA
ncbi:hypothetical protein PFISCL1PPCAC_25155, partial [Pristionchus fissidentatus]